MTPMALELFLLSLGFLGLYVAGINHIRQNRGRPGWLLSLYACGAGGLGGLVFTKSLDFFSKLFFTGVS
jgi:hypothetical protein